MKSYKHSTTALGSREMLLIRGELGNDGYAIHFLIVEQVAQFSNAGPGLKSASLSVRQWTDYLRISRKTLVRFLKVNDKICAILGENHRLIAYTFSGDGQQLTIEIPKTNRLVRL